MTLVAVFGAEMTVTTRCDGSKCEVPASSLEAREAVDDARQLRHRVVGDVRVGRVALLALDDEVAVERAAPADLDLVADAIAARRLAHNASVQNLAAGLQPVEHLDGAVDAVAFLIAGDEQRYRAGHLAATGGEEALRGGDKTGDLPLHVDGAATVENAVADLRGERRCAPGVDIARRYDVGVAGKAKVRPGVAEPRVEVFDVREARLGKRHAVTLESGGDKHSLEQGQGAAFDGRHAFAADQRLGQRNRIGCGRHAGCWAPARGSGP